MGQSLSVSVPHSFPRTKVFLTGSSIAATFRRVTVVAKKKKVKVSGPEFVLDAEVVPMPEKKRIGAKKIYFPLDILEVGRSFTTPRSVDTLRSAIRRFRVDEGHEEKKFMMEKQADGRMRCWREV